MTIFEPGIRTNRAEAFASLLIAGWIRLCRHTIRWKRQGDEDFISARREGPVLLVFWHSRVVMASSLLPPEALPMVNLFAVNRDGRISAGVQKRFGLRPIGLSGRGRGSNETRAARAALTAVRAGFALAVPGDNSRAGARKLAPAPLDWARAAGVPVFVCANSVRHHWRLPGWDKMLFPLPFSRGASVFRRWNHTLPRRAPKKDIARAHESLTTTLDAALAEADSLVGLPPGP